MTQKLPVIIHIHCVTTLVRTRGIRFTNACINILHTYFHKLILNLSKEKVNNSYYHDFNQSLHDI